MFDIRRVPTMVSFAAILMPITIATGWASAVGGDRKDEPSFSARAITIRWGQQIQSPDGKVKVHLQALDAPLKDSPGDFPTRVVVDVNGERLTATFGFGLDAELLWSPDSKAFSITGSIVGANGEYQTDVFLIQPGKLVQIRLTNFIERAFGHPVRCGWPEPPNVAAVKWLVPSSQILVAAEIIHHSNCDSFGTFKAYAVDLTGPRVTKVYDQLKAKRMFGADLGGELLEADDNCIRDRKSCRVGSNWLSNH